MGNPNARGRGRGRGRGGGQEGGSCGGSKLASGGGCGALKVVDITRMNASIVERRALGLRMPQEEGRGGSRYTSRHGGVSATGCRGAGGDAR
jgi:hypothetical protein